MSAKAAHYRRVLLKISGEVLCGAEGESIGAERLAFVAGEVASAHAMGAEVGLVVGGGNIVRGAALARQDQAWRVKADQMGMLATVINALALQLELARQGVDAAVFSAITLGPVCESFTAERARAALDAGQVAIFAAGTGNPFFTTDTAAALRALELRADILLKATKVDGVYDSDPKLNPQARRFDVLAYDQAVNMNLRVMDQTAFALCRDNGLPILVFDLVQPGNVARAVAGEPIGTLVREA